MPKLNFLEFVGRSVPKDRVRIMCSKMELGDIETEFILKKYCNGKRNLTLEQCSDLIPIDQIKTMLPDLIRLVRAWIQHNTGFFCLEELEGIALYNLTQDKSTTKMQRKYYKDEEYE